MGDMSDDSSSDNRSLDDESSDVSSLCSSSGESSETGYASLSNHSICSFSTETSSTGNYSLNSEAYNKNSSEWIKHNSELNSLEKYSDFKIDESVIDKNRNHLQSTDSSIDSNKQPENDAKLCSKKTQERNTGVNKPGSSVEVTNPINPSKLLGAHQGYSAGPKAENMSSVEIEVFGKLAHHLGISSAEDYLGDLLSHIPLSKHSGDSTFKRKYFDEDPDFNKTVISTIDNSLQSSPDDNDSSSDKMTACQLFLMALMAYYQSKISMVDGKTCKRSCICIKVILDAK